MGKSCQLMWSPGDIHDLRCGIMNNVPTLHQERHRTGYPLVLLGSLGVSLLLYLAPEWITLVGYFLICISILTIEALTDHVAHRLNDTPEPDADPAPLSRPTNHKPDSKLVVPKNQPLTEKSVPGRKYAKAPLADVLSINADECKRELVISLM
jgi:hypothetical protein